MDREKVIKGLECCTFILGKRKCNECPYQKGLPDNGCYQLQDDFHAILKEQENKKLINADKLREKLGLAENCDKCTRDSWKCGKDSCFSLTDFCTMLDMAIEELIQEGR